MNYRLVIKDFKPLTINDCLIDTEGFIFGTGEFVGGRNRLSLFQIGDATVDGETVLCYPYGNKSKKSVYKIHYAEFYVPDKTNRLVTNIVLQPA